jgi:hypothetical protein
LLPGGDVRRLEIFRSAPLEISARRVSGARALEAAEEPLDQVGEGGG